MRTIHVSPEFPLNHRMREAVRRGKLKVVRDAMDKGGMDDKVRVYWDNSNIFRGAANAAPKQRDFAPRGEVRIDFQGIMHLASAGRKGLVIPARAPLNIPQRAYSTVIAASTPPSEGALWGAMGFPKNIRILKKFDRRGGKEQNDPGKEQQVPDMQLKLEMMRDILDSPSPGVAVLLSSDGGFLSSVQRMHAEGWAVEILAWRGDCGRKLRDWAQENGVFVPLDDYWEAVTYAGKASRAWNRRTGQRKIKGWRTERLSAQLTRSDLLRRPKASPAPTRGGGAKVDICGGLAV